MSDEQNITPAGGDAGASVPENLSMSAAADLLDKISSKPEERPQPDNKSETSENPAAMADTGETEQVEDKTQAEPGAPEGDPAENQGEVDQSVEFEKLHGNTKVRLRDGTEWTVGELKRRIDDLRGLDQGKEEFARQQQAFQQLASQTAQQAQQFQQIAPHAIAALQSSLPQIPAEPTYDPNDPLRYIEEKAAWDRTVSDYNAKVNQIRQIQHQQQVVDHQRHQEQQKNLQQYISDQRTKLFDAMPDLRDEAKRNEFYGDFLKFGKQTYGFTDEELNRTYDHRLMSVMKDAIAFRKLQANPPKPNTAPKQKAGVPVATPGRRVSGQEAQQVKREELVSRVHKPGGLSMNEGARLLEALEKG